MTSVAIIMAMVAAKFLEVGLNTIIKAATTNGMSKFMFVVYSNALALCFLLPSTFLYQRKVAPPPISRSIICRIFVTSMLSCAVQTLMYSGIQLSSRTSSSAVIDLVPAFTFIFAIVSIFLVFICIFDFDLLRVVEKECLVLEGDEATEDSSSSSSSPPYGLFKLLFFFIFNLHRRLSQLPPPKATWSRSCLHLRSDIQALAASSSSIASRRKKKKKYGGVLPSILRSLELRDDVENTLDSFGENLSAKEQTVILKEQRSWERLIRVFDWFKSQKEYVPNVIHYNVVIRALGKAQRWDELRLCWIEMAKSGVLPANDTYRL
ncbi:hypothetical protein K1719_006376 [Acacia pycnantha]|nr:hypothetical protein K1719_006376 [Acacia pycnantha]